MIGDDHRKPGRHGLEDGQRLVVRRAGMDEHVEGGQEADGVEAEARQPEVHPLGQGAQSLLFGALAEDDDDSIGEPAGGVDDQLRALPVDQAHGAADHRRTAGDRQLLPGLVAGEERREGDAVRHDLVGTVQLAQPDDLRLGPLGGEDLHVHPAQNETAETPPHLVVRIRREVDRGHHGGRPERDGGHDGVLGGVGMGEHGVEDHRPGLPDRTEGPDETRDVEVAAYAVEAHDRNLAGDQFRLELVGHDAEHHRVEPPAVQLVQEAQEVTLDAAEDIPLDVVDDPDRVLHAWLRGTGQGGGHFLGHRGRLLVR